LAAERQQRGRAAASDLSRGLDRDRPERAQFFFNLHRSDLAKHFEAESSLILPPYAIAKAAGVTDCKDRI
jgi:hypothetical protein